MNVLSHPLGQPGDRLFGAWFRSQVHQPLPKCLVRLGLHAGLGSVSPREGRTQQLVRGVAIAFDQRLKKVEARHHPHCLQSLKRLIGRNGNGFWMDGPSLRPPAPRAKQTGKIFFARALDFRTKFSIMKRVRAALQLGPWRRAGCVVLRDDPLACPMVLDSACRNHFFLPSPQTLRGRSALLAVRSEPYFAARLP